MTASERAEASHHDALRVALYSMAPLGSLGGVQRVMEELSAQMRRRGLRVVDFRTRGGGRGETKPVRMAQRAVIGAKLALTHPHVVNIHMATGHANYFLGWRRIFGFQVVVSVHGSEIRLLRPESLPLIRSILMQADAVTAVSRELAERVEALGVDPARVHFVPNGVDLAFWSPSPVPARRAPQDPPVIVAAGRLEPVKGCDILLEAFARLRARGVEARLHLAGDGAERGRLEAQARSLGIDDRVKFLGVMDREGVRELFRAATLLVMPSRSEGMPLVLLEAMACGLPVVATRVGGVPEVVDEATAVLTAPEPELLAEGLARALEDPEATARRAERALAQAGAHSLDACAARFMAVLRGLSAPGAPRDVPARGTAESAG